MNKNLPPIIDEIFSVCPEEKTSCWLLQNPKFRLYFSLIEIIEQGHFFLKISEGVSVLDEFCRIM
jgi:hypothetical protein